RPDVDGWGGELRTVSDLEDLRQPALGRNTLQDGDDSVSGQRPIDLDGRTLTTPVLDYREKPKAVPVRQAVAHARPCSTAHSEPVLLARVAARRLSVSCGPWNAPRVRRGDTSGTPVCD